MRSDGDPQMKKGMQNEIDDRQRIRKGEAIQFLFHYGANCVPGTGGFFYTE